MKTYTVELQTAKRFQQSNLVEVAKVKTTNSKKAIEALKFYLKTGLDPIDAEVIPLTVMNIDPNCSFHAYVKKNHD